LKEKAVLTQINYTCIITKICPLMFAWVYLKDEKWVIGTGANENAVEYADRFYNHVKEKIPLQGKIVKKEDLHHPKK